VFAIQFLYPRTKVIVIHRYSQKTLLF